jgi:putative peptidoglycan lipid II flippase
MRRPNLVNASLIIAGSYVLSNLAGFVARALINGRFGAGFEQDAFRAASGIPDLLFNLLAGGALASAFIPVFATHLADSPARAWRLAGRVAWAVLLVMTVAVGLTTALLFAFGAQLGPLLFGRDDPAYAMLALALMRIMFLGTLVFSISGLLMGVLQSSSRFLAPALAPMLFQTGQILGATALSGLGIYGLAWGYVLGALLHLGVQLPALWRARPAALAAVDPITLREDTHAVLTRIPWRVLGAGATQINKLVNIGIAGGLSAGALSVFDNAFAIMILPQAVIAQAAATALFPTISALAGRGDRDGFGRTFSEALALVTALSLPAAAGLITLGAPLVGLFFERGAWTASNTEAVGLTLAMLTLGLSAHCALELITRGFFAVKDTRTPVMIGLAGVGLNIVLSVALTRGLAAAGHPLPVIGLALSNAIATTLETVVMFVLLKRRAPEIAARPVIHETARAGVAALAMAGVIFAGVRTLGDNAAVTVAVGVAGVLVFAGVAALTRSALFGFVRRRLGR